jgi:hypothetical protein
VVHIFTLILLLQGAPGPACADAADCRTRAEAAAARGDYETFHDLAWRAVQKGRRNDTDLMFLLARAQSLSGHLDDALVMLERIADLGGKPDVAANPDFAHVVQLQRWPELAAKLGISPDSPPSAPRAEGKPASAVPAPEGKASSTAPATAGADGKPSSPLRAAEGSSAPADPPALSFDAPSATPMAIAHDAVSRRFVLGDRSSSRLFIIDEVSHHVVNYASAATAGFFDQLTGVAIDARRGDLWVVSAKGQGANRASTVHKLQLVSGRALMEVSPADGAGATRLVDVAVTPDGTVYAIDDVDARLFRARPGARRFELVMRLESAHPTALAAEDDRVLYVAASDGLLRVDLASNKATRVKSVEDLTGFVSLAWHADTLVGVERVAESFLVVRVALDPSGTRAKPRAILAASTEPTVGTLTPEGFYFLSTPGAIRLIKLR